MYLETWNDPMRNEPIYDVITIGYPIISIISIISTLGIVCITIKYREFRKSSAVPTIAWCMATLLLSAFVLPVSTNNIVKSSWGHGSTVCRVWLFILYFAKACRGLQMSVMATIPYADKFYDDSIDGRRGCVVAVLATFISAAVALGLAVPFALTATTTANAENSMTFCASNSTLVFFDVSLATSLVGSLIPCGYTIAFLVIVTYKRRYVSKYPGAAISIIVVASFSLLCIPGEILFVLFKTRLYEPSTGDNLFNGFTLAYFCDAAIAPLLCLVLPCSSFKTIRSNRATSADSTVAQSKRTDVIMIEAKEKLNPRGHLHHVAMYGRRAFNQHTADLFLGKSYTRSGRAAAYF